MESSFYQGPPTKKRIESDEAKKIIDQIDARWLIEHFGVDRKAAKEYIKKEFGGKPLVTRDIVEKAYCTLGKGFDSSMPSVCSDLFWKKVKDVTTNPKLQTSSFLRYAELAISDQNNIRLITDGSLRKKPAGELRTENNVFLNDMTDICWNSNKTVFVVTATKVYVIRQIRDDEDITWHFYDSWMLDNISGIIISKYSSGKIGLTINYNAYDPFKDCYRDRAWIRMESNPYPGLEDKLAIIDPENSK